MIFAFGVKRLGLVAKRTEFSLTVRRKKGLFWDRITVPAYECERGCRIRAKDLLQGRSTDASILVGATLKRKMPKAHYGGKLDNSMDLIRCQI